MSTRLLIPALLAAVLHGCVAVEPGQSRNQKASAVNVQLGLGYLQQNKLELADEKLDKALRQDPNSAAAHNAYAILQERLKQYELAETHYRRATDLDPKDSQAANNYGAFLCRRGREREAEKYFLRALDNPLYKTPEYAYTNAAICLLKVGERARASSYVDEALKARIDFGPALLTRAEMLFDAGRHTDAKFYIDRFHLSGRASAKSLWLAIRNTLELDAEGEVAEYGARLEQDFPGSDENQAWLKIK